jgi:hypothetical protein
MKLQGNRSINILLLSVLTVVFELFSQPEPGDVFREYRWFCESCDAGQALRVGGSAGYGAGNLDYVSGVDKTDAVKAEIVIEKILCHDGTKGLRFSLNDNEWVEVPELESIPSPQWEYQHHIYPSVPVDLADINEGGNTIKLEVSSEHTWGWPQNLLNGIHLRVYYDANAKPHPTGSVTSPYEGQEIGASLSLTAEASSSGGSIESLEYFGLHDDVNYEGEGNYRQWHYVYFHGELIHHIGTSTASPYEVDWSTEWVPDQDEPLSIAARITDETGMIYMTEAVSGLSLKRGDFFSVELCQPYDVPQQWVTRKGQKTEKFDVAGDLSNATAAQLIFSSWSPGYCPGIYINGTKVFDKEGPNYQTYYHRISLDNISPLKAGENTLHTGGGPGNVHGMEVNWPGIQVLVQYGDPAEIPEITAIHPETAEGDARFSVKLQEYTGDLSIDVHSPGHCEITVFRADGGNVFSLKGQGERRYRIPANRFQPGLHVLRIKSGGRGCSRKIIIGY